MSFIDRSLRDRDDGGRHRELAALQSINVNISFLFKFKSKHRI